MQWRAMQPGSRAGSASGGCRGPTAFAARSDETLPRRSAQALGPPGARHEGRGRPQRGCRRLACGGCVAGAWTRRRGMSSTACRALHVAHCMSSTVCRARRAFHGPGRSRLHALARRPAPRLKEDGGRAPPRRTNSRVRIFSWPRASRRTADGHPARHGGCGPAARPSPIVEVRGDGPARVTRISAGRLDGRVDRGKERGRGVG